MTERVDFYVLQSATPRQRWMVACKLAEKAYLQDLTVLLVNGTAADAASLDDLLWSFNDRSFVPHEVRHTASGGSPSTSPAPVQLVLDADAVDSTDLLVNLSDRLPSRWERFGRIAEIIDADDERRRLGRERFKTYRDAKLPVETHQLGDAAGA